MTSLSIIRYSFVLAAMLSLGSLTQTLQAGSGPAKIFILAGQSNMVGHGMVEGETTPGTLAHTVANDPDGNYQFLVNGGGGWVQRPDVWYHSTSQADGNGPLTVGLGFDNRFSGPEIGFGHAMGDLHEELVILIKVAQGGRDLADDFLPPSSRPEGTPSPVADQDTGYWYQRIVTDVADFIANDLASVPGYDATKGYEIAGFGWHQGWNDRSNAAASAAYETNLVNLINDLRGDLAIPDLPFVIATTGMNGPGSYSEVELAQLAVADASKYPQFEGNVAAVDTRTTYEGLQFWYGVGLSPSSIGYHWNLNGKSYLHVGLAMADAMSVLQPARCPFRLRAEGGASGVTLSWQNGTEMPTSVQILRDGVELAAAAPVDPPTFLDTSATPGVHNYTLNFTMPGTPCDPLTLSFNGGITDLKIDRQAAQFVLEWTNNMAYAGIEVRRNGVLLDTLPGSQTTYTDASPPTNGIATYSVAPTTGSSAPATLELNLSLAGQLGVLDLTANYGINPMTGELWKEGDTYRLIFTTSTTRNATSSDIADYNAFVNAAAAGSSAFPNLADATWYVVASTPTVDARDNTLTNKAVPHPDAAVYLTDGSTLFAGNNNDLWSGNNSSGQDVDPANGSDDLIHVRYDENGAAVALGLEVWTGTHQEGYGSGALGNGGDCTIGILVTSTDGRFWMRVGSKSPAETKPLYAISEVLTVSNNGAPDDSTPPEPGVMSWETEPTATSATVITMTATTATDASGVQYRFTETSGNPGGTSSGWQDSRTHEDTGLTPGTTYTYTVQARDKSGNGNTNTASAPASATTPTLPIGQESAAIYEGFDYDAGSLDGADGGTGFTGAWSTIKNAPQVVSPGLGWGTLSAVGNSVSQDSGGGAAAREIGSSLSTGGLIGNGDTLWFGVVLKLGSDALVNVDFNFSLGTDGFADYGTGEFGQRVNLNRGEGIGFALFNVNSTTSGIRSAYWQDDTDADSYANRNLSTTTATLGTSSSILIVGRIDWGANDTAAETLTLYAPDSNLNLGTAIMSATSLVALDQSAFDTVAFQFKGGAIIDEIRFGATYEDAVGLGGSASDYDTWASGPFVGTLSDSSSALDFDIGGLETGIEWVVGGDPTDSSDDLNKAPSFDNTTDPDKFLFIFRRSDLANADPNTTITVEYGSNLSRWNTAAHEGTGPTQITITEVNDFYGSGVDKVTVAIPRSLAVGEKLFARLKITVDIP